MPLLGIILATSFPMTCGSCSPAEPSSVEDRSKVLGPAIGSKAIDRWEMKRSRKQHHSTPISFVRDAVKGNSPETIGEREALCG